MGIRAGILLATLIAAALFGAAAEAARERSPATESLFLAVRTNNMGAVKRSLLAGADVEAENEEGRTPIDVAVDRGHFDIAHYLLAWRKHQTKPTPVVPAAPVVVEPPPEPKPEIMPVAREVPSVLSPTPVKPVTTEPLAPSPPPTQTPPLASTTPAAVPPATIAAPAPAATPAPMAIPQTAPSPAPAPAPATTPPAAEVERVDPDGKKSGGMFDGIARFFSGEPAKPKPAPQPAAASPPPVAPLPATGKITPPGEAAPAKQEGFLDSIGRWFSGKGKSESPADAPKPESSVKPPAEPTTAAAPTTATKPAATATASEPADPTPAKDSLLEHIANVLAEAQSAHPPSPPPAPQPAAASPSPTPEPASQPVPAPPPDKPDQTASAPEAQAEPSFLDSITRALKEAEFVSPPPTYGSPPTQTAAPPAAEPPPTQPAATAAAPEPPPTAVVAEPAEPAPAPAPATTPAVTAADAGTDKQVAGAPPTEPEAEPSTMLGRITDFFSVTPNQPPPRQPAATPAPSHTSPAPTVRAAVEPWLGANRRIGAPRPPEAAPVCVDKAAIAATFCVEELIWPEKIANAFDVQTPITRGRQAIVRYDGGQATQYHALFPTAEFRRVVGYFAATLGPPGDMPARRAVVVGGADRENRTARWLGPKGAGGDMVLEVREIDDLRWSSPPDLGHGVVRLYRVGGEPVFQHVSWSDFLLTKIRQARE